MVATGSQSGQGGNYSPRWSGISPNCFVVINSSLYGEVRARIPNEYELTISSVWGELLPEYSSIGILRYGQVLTGIAPKAEAMSAQIWSGTSPVSMTLDLELLADYDARTEIVENIRKIGKMVLPRRGTGPNSEAVQLWLRPPGPTIGGFSRETLDLQFNPDSDIITIEIGKFIRFSGVIITDASFTFDGSVLRDGYPISAKGRITFKTYFIMTSNKFAQVFLDNPKVPFTRTWL